MAIDRLSPTAALIAAIRGEAIKRGGVGKPGAASKAHTAAAEQQGRGERPSVAQLRGQLSELVASVAAEDPAAVKRVRPALIRTVLLWQFGPQLRERPQWQQLMERIEQELDRRDPSMQSLSALVRDLQKGSGQP
ncbi:MULTISPECIES: hypothetical protein [unclassified Xanthomonas]|uniref:hypothetical protein n=1 Tax=unclassified Xanthomonas TaxID=2643310 RepID=UPI002A822B7D|nr:MULTISPECIES: hypothetical protein [unclassified Xanthomonas]MDY4297355.1 hypothetical protein [Xanthomonas sp. LF02-5]MDY4359149.1 hypothetical protein [Xanthomonas sp. LF04-12]